MLRLGTENEVLNVVDDQFGSPTFASDLARAIVTIADLYHQNKTLKWGTYHFCGQGRASWHQFAQKVFELARPVFPLKIHEVNPVPTTAYPTPAKRPANSVLDCHKIEETFGVLRPPWEESLHKMLTEGAVDIKALVKVAKTQ